MHPTCASDRCRERRHIRDSRLRRSGIVAKTGGLLLDEARRDVGAGIGELCCAHVMQPHRPPGTREGYFERLAPTYDDWWTRTGRMAGTEAIRPGWREEVDALRATIESLEPARTLDVFMRKI